MRFLEKWKSKDYWDTFLSALWPLLRSSWMSIAIIAVMLVVVNFTAQGTTLIIDLFYQPYNSVWIIVLINFLDLCLSHFPVYIAEFRRYNSTKVWRMSAETVFAGLGIISYEPPGGQKTEEYKRKEDVENHLRRWIGVSFYILWIYSLLAVYQSIYCRGLPVLTITVGLFVTLLIIYNWLNGFKKKTRKAQQLALDYDKKCLHKTAKIIFTVYTIILIALAINLGVIGYYACCLDWSKISLLFLISCSGLSAIAFVFFRILRSQFAVYFGLSTKHHFEIKTKELRFDFIKEERLPPRKECAPLWHESLLRMMPDLELTLLIGSYAQAYYLGDLKKRTLTETVQNYKAYLPQYLPLPHPSPRNNIWLKKNDWFAAELIPQLRKQVSKVLINQ